ncbi:hypothetical protein [Klebsiella phage 05F01]|nr:hypothetical protein [Klebsiella phage 05F01]
MTKKDIHVNINHIGGLTFPHFVYSGGAVEKKVY